MEDYRKSIFLAVASVLLMMILIPRPCMAWDPQDYPKWFTPYVAYYEKNGITLPSPSEVAQAKLGDWQKAMPDITNSELWQGTNYFRLVPQTNAHWPYILYPEWFWSVLDCWYK